MYGGPEPQVEWRADDDGGKEWCYWCVETKGEERPSQTPGVVMQCSERNKHGKEWREKRVVSVWSLGWFPYWETGCPKRAKPAKNQRLDRDVT